MKASSYLVAVCLFGMVTSAYGQIWFQKAQEKSGKLSPTFAEIEREFEAHWADRDPTRKGCGYKPFKRVAEFASTRLGPDGRFNTRGMWNAWQEYQTVYGSKMAAIGKLDADWRPLGPSQVPEAGYPGYKVNGGAGRVNCIAFQPNDANVIWVGAPDGGAWKSADGGQSWRAMTDSLPNLGVSSIAIDPTNPNIIYIATGDGDAPGAQGTYTIGVIKSTDGGATWSTTGLSTEEHQKLAIYKLAIHPADPHVIFAAANFGLYRSVDGGASWHALIDGVRVTDIEADPVYPNYWYATVWGQGIVYTQDSGDSWTWATGLPQTGAGFGRIELTICPSDTNVLYSVFAAETQDAFNGGLFGVYRSTTGGFEWEQVHYTDLDKGYPNLLGSFNGLEYDGPDVGGQGSYDLDIIVHPTDPATVFVGGVNIWKSSDGGLNWGMASFWLDDDNDFPVPYTHADQHAFVYAPNGVLFIGNDGGIFRYQSGGWVDLSDGLEIHQCYRIDVSQSNPNVSLVGAQDNGCSQSRSGQWKAATGGDGTEVLIDPTNDQTLYTSSQNGRHSRSDDGGVTWKAIGPNDQGGWITPLIIDPQNPSVLYRASDTIQVSPDRGDSWYALSPQISGYILSSMAVAPSDPNVIYAADDPENQQSQVLAATRDGGENWASINSPGYVSFMAVDPRDPNVLYVTRGGFEAGQKVFVTTDGGNQWANISGSLPNFPVNCILVDPDRPDDVYIGTDLGVFVSSNGADWLPFNQGMPIVIVRDLAIQRETRQLLAGTFGRGLWSSPLPGASGGGGGGHVVPDNSTRWVPHVTRAGGLFETLLTITNNSGNASSITLQPYDTAGARLSPQLVQLAPWEFGTWPTGTVFPSQNVSHFSITGDSHVVVTAGYRLASGLGATAHVNETSLRGNYFAMYPGEWDTIFDGMALINLSTNRADISTSQVAKNGKVLSTKIFKRGLAPYAKTLAVFGNEFANVPDSLIQIQSSQEVAILLLRGTYPDASPGYLYQTSPILNQASGSRLVPHVTPPNAAFTTQLYFTNFGGSNASLTLNPFAGDGSPLGAKNVSIPAQSFLRMPATQAFTGSNVSHFNIQGPSDCVVTVGYRIANGAGATAHVNESRAVSGPAGQNFILYQGEWDKIFDGMAIVNLGGAPAEIKGYQYDAAGNPSFSQVLQPSLAPNAKYLLVFDSVFPTRPDQQIYLTSSQPAQVIFLRGTRPGTNPAYLYQTEPVPLTVP